MRLLPGFLSPEEQKRLSAEVGFVIDEAPFFQPTMPKSSRPMSVKMSNAGKLGWMSDVRGYRYSEVHPVVGTPWPSIPSTALDVWRKVSGYPLLPECCLVNYYTGPSSKMGLHQDRDEDDFDAPVVSISLGDTCVFRVGGFVRSDKTKSFRLASGDVLVLGGPSRLRFHGVDRVISGSSRLIPGGGRINLTLRRVTKPA